MWSTIILSLLVTMGSAAAQRGGGGEGPPGRFQWEFQAPWGIAHRDTINETIKLMGANPGGPSIQVEPFRIFDNVYYVGLKNVSSYLVTTGDGLVLLDATFPQTADQLMDKVRKLGFKPENIKYILVSHSHIDHYGGAARIKEVTGARVIMSAEDWRVVEQPQGQQQGRGGPMVSLKRDLVKGEGESLKVGDSEFKFYVTPGHTPGALSVEFRAFDRGKAYRVLSPGGLGMQFGSEGTTPFIQSMEHLLKLGPWDVLLGNHPFYMLETVENVRAALARRGTGNSHHPLVQGSAKINEWLAGAAKVARAKLAAETAKETNR